MNQTAKEKLVALALAKMPPTSLRLGLLEFAGMTTNEALNVLGVGRSNRYKVITALRAAGIADPRPIREVVAAYRSPDEPARRRLTWKQYAQENGLIGDWSRARLYSMEPQAMHDIYLKQAGRCYLCGDSLPPNLGKIHVEHDHDCCPSPRKLAGLGGKISCGKCVRGLACSSCNRLIGIARDDPYRLRRIADNLEGANHRVAAAVATEQLRTRWLAGASDEHVS